MPNAKNMKLFSKITGGLSEAQVDQVITAF